MCVRSMTVMRLKNVVYSDNQSCRDRCPQRDPVFVPEIKNAEQLKLPRILPLQKEVIFVK